MSLPVLSTFSGSTWDDFNRDHLQESGTRLPNVTVTLTSATGTNLSRSSTDAAGTYEFRTNYRDPIGVQFTQLDKYTLASADIDGNSHDSIDSDADPLTGIAPVSFTPGDTRSNIDAGFQFELNAAEIHSYDATDLPQGGVKRVVSTIHVSDPLVIQDLNLRLEISQQMFSDLEADLVAPNGTKVRLFERVTQNNVTGPDFHGVLDDDASKALNSQLPPYLGRFLPQNPLAAFNGPSTPDDFVWEIMPKDSSTDHEFVADDRCLLDRLFADYEISSDLFS